MQVQLGSRLVGDGCPTFIVAEIGQNHQGDVYTALRLVREAVAAGADAVKFQLRDAESEFPSCVLDAPHPRPEHAFGRTYREHRAALDLSADQLAHIKDRVRYNRWNVEFFATPCALSCVEPLERMGVEFYKLASKDHENTRLILELYNHGKPLIASVEAYSRWPAPLRDPDVMLYCESKYPTPLADIRWENMRDMPPLFGYSDHTGCPSIAPAAVAQGASVIECHLTFSKKDKGTDHRASLTVGEFRQAVQAIRDIDQTRVHEEVRERLARDRWRCRGGNGCVVDVSASRAG